MYKLNTTINVPKNIKIIIWKKESANSNLIFLKSNNKIYKFSYNKKNVIIDKWSNSIILIKNKIDNLKLENKLNVFLKTLNLYIFSKIKFKGKGFRIKFFKKTKIIKFYFGKSHKTFIFLKKIGKKKINKYKFMIFCINKNSIKSINKMIVNIKKINFYTLRGLRLSRQIIYKRKGKKGTYI